MAKLEALKPVLMLSPHLDDAVFSCGHFLMAHPSTIVVTVLAGAPEVTHEGYNSKTTGKTYAPDAIKVRRDEDLHAMNSLGATPIWLDLLDSDYAAYRPATNYVEVMRHEIARVLDETRPGSVFAPLGLIHSDHLAVSEACRTLMSEYALTWYLYMDLPYGLASRITVSKRLRAFRQRADLVAFDGYDAEPGLKQRVMSLYETQYEKTRQNYRKRFDATTRGAERYWRVENPL